MRIRTSMAALIFAASSVTTFAADALRDGFDAPPAEAMPRTWWHWVSGNVSKEGITLDLEAMKRVGIAEAQVFNVNQGPEGSVRTLSSQWNELTKFAIQEADRLGIELAFENCAGWSTSGGPWVKPEQSMQFVYWSITSVAGGKDVDITLPKGKDAPEYRDIAVLAFPTPRGDGAEAAPKVSASEGVLDAGKLMDGDTKTEAMLAWPAQAKSAYVQFDFAEPTTRGSLSIRFDKYADRPKGEVLSSDDGTTFKPLARFEGDGTIVFAPVTTRHLRVVIDRPRDKTEGVKLAELSWDGARLANARAKAGFHADVASRISTPWNVPAEMGIASDRLVDVTSKLTPDGKLKWSAPAGDWTILRIGHASNGKKNHPSVPEATGLEVDKLSADAVASHFNNGFMGQVLNDAGPLAGKSLKYVLCDSWEAGSLNWTPVMREAFMKRFGYDPIPWLPTLTGRVVGSVDQSERFLWDFRRLIADMTADNHFGTLQKLSREHGLQFYAEAPGIGMPCVADELQCKARTDIPMGEFWLHGTGSADVKEAASAAHINGKRWVAAESFTSGQNEAGWKKDPYSVKALGDKHFALGLNRIVFHRYAHQSFVDRAPGVTMGPWGLNFERTQTWWEPGAAWMKYIARCQWLLSQGEAVSDVLFFYGEWAPNTLPDRAELKPTIPAGYDYDGCDYETLTKATVKDGNVVLLSGASYRVLALAESDSMTPQTLAVVDKLVRAGATIVGVKPTKSPSLAGYPKADDEVKRLADALWSRAVGTGRVYDGLDVAPALKAMGLSPDFSPQANARVRVMAAHRRVGSDDVYFVSNQQYQAVNVACSFRVSGKRPELWHPDTGVVEQAPVYQEDKGITTIPLYLTPAGSTFVVFRDAPRPNDWVTALRVPQADTAAAPTVQIVKAVYQPVDGSAGKDVTDRINQAWTSDPGPMQVTNGVLGGDPKFGVEKELVVDYVVDGKPVHVAVGEGEELTLPGMPGAPSPVVELRRDADGKLKLRAWTAGDVGLTFASGKTWQHTVASAAPTTTVEGAWDVRFPPGRGAPESAKFDSLVSWTASSDGGVKYFSGTATYHKTITIPAAMVGEGKVVELNLGDVKNLAEVTLNGQNLGVLWKPPFKCDISSVVRAGDNDLEVKVTNLWPNRLIGDLKLPEAQRTTWTTFNPYKASSPLLPSGLLGPVTVRSTDEIAVEVK
ncbi:MAG: glycosyl hydrolase [Tepidisphaeraceae bacterium]